MLDTTILSEVGVKELLQDARTGACRHLVRLMLEERTGQLFLDPSTHSSPRKIHIPEHQARLVTGPHFLVYPSEHHNDLDKMVAVLFRDNHAVHAYVPTPERSLIQFLISDNPLRTQPYAAIGTRRNFPLMEVEPVGERTLDLTITALLGYTLGRRALHHYARINPE